MSSPKEVLRSLLSLINSSAEAAIREYEVAGCEVPSIDATAEPQLPTDTTGLKKALRVLEGAFHQLSITLTPPSTTMFTRALATNDVACLRVAVNCGIADVIYGVPEGVHISKIAVATGLHQGKLLKVMRTLAATHCFRETAPQTFANNPLSLTLRDSNTTSALVKMRSNETNKCAVSNFYDALVDPEYGHSLDKRRTAWSWGIKEEMPDATMFDYFAKHPKTFQQFHRAMGGLSKITGLEGVINQFPWREFPQGTTVCDVGSGVGAVSIELAKKYPNLHLTLQDLPSVITQAEQRWATEYPVATAEKRVDYVPFDFFKDLPVRGQDIYYVCLLSRIRQIVHDWPADDAVKILKNVRDGAKPGSRILIHEYIVPSGVTSESGVIDAGVETAPKPLLPNYGYGSARTYLSDVNMLILLNAGERTLEEFKEIGARAGLRFVKVWDFLETGLVEFAPD
ncbi:S-adenosyl-L-methionine-dependent methyltransferase, partial [Auriscalpium vulgare]